MGYWGKNKFNAIRVEYDGRSFHSKLEANVYNILVSRQNNKELKIIKYQQHIHLYSLDIKLCEYWPDFTCIDLKTNEIFWVEAKGKSDNADWRIKFNLWKAGGPGKLEMWYGDHKRPFLGETIIPIELGLHIRRDQVYGKL